MFFRGYIGLKNGKPVEKFKNIRELRTYEQIKTLPEFAGVLARNAVLIDVDSSGEAQILFEIVQKLSINCRVYGTDRGMHFCFVDRRLSTNKTKCTLAVGLTADIKLGNSDSYEKLKSARTPEREVLREVDPSLPCLVPKWLWPLKKKTPIHFIGLEEHGGRNDELFRYILTLQNNGYTKEECRETVRIINEFVLLHPMSADELEVVLRDEAFKLPVFFADGQFAFDEFARYLQNNSSVCKINDQLHLFRDGIYVSGKQKFEAEMIQLMPRMSRAMRAEIYDYLDATVSENKRSLEVNLIAFNNGIYNADTAELLEFSPEFVITNKIPWDYNPNTECPLVDETLNKLACGVPEVRKIIEEAVGYTFYRRNELGKVIFLVGNKSNNTANGKSTFFEMLSNMLGDDNISSLDLKELGERFNKAELFGKLANIGDDIEDDYIPNTSIFKKFATGNRVMAERKGERQFNFKNYAKMFFSANSLPRLGKGKDTAAIIRRMVIVPFHAVFESSQRGYDPYIISRLRSREAMERLIVLGLQGLERLLSQKRFTRCSLVDSLVEEYERANNPILNFFEEIGGLKAFLNEPVVKLYNDYKGFCIGAKLQSLGKIEFSRQVCRQYNIKTTQVRMQGERVQIFVRDDK